MDLTLVITEAPSTKLHRVIKPLLAWRNVPIERHRPFGGSLRERERERGVTLYMMADQIKISPDPCL